MKDICNHKFICPACRAEVLHSHKWVKPICPMCFIKAVEAMYRGIWRCNDDRIDYPAYPDHVWFYVVNTYNGVFIMNKITFQSANMGIPIRYVYQGFLNDCQEFVKRYYEKKNNEPPKKP